MFSEVRDPISGKLLAIRRWRDGAIFAPERHVPAYLEYLDWKARPPEPESKPPKVETGRP